MAFPAHHPQGLVKIGDRLFFSSVEVTTPPRRGAGGEGFDCDTGRGVGHLFEATMDGRLVADVVLGEGTMYHPGGIDFDGRDIWVPVAEYRPNSRSIVYRVDPGDAKGRGGVPLRRSPWRRRLQHGRPHPARGELGLALDLSLRPRPVRAPDRTRTPRRPRCA